MKKWLVAILVGVLFTLGACGNDADETATDGDTSEEVDVAAMEEILKESCVSCHADGFALEAGETDLPVDEIQDLIINGIGSMPAIDEVSEEEALELAQYLAKE